MKLISSLTLMALLSFAACSHHHKKSCCGENKQDMTCTKEKCDKPCCDKEKKCSDGSCTKEKTCTDGSCEKKKS